ncbi:MAG TPA: hypothetical protein PL029_01670 [Bacteroidia bacterium]|nr:hypothetical protein [Bacteroidia bacterium]
MTISTLRGEIHTAVDNIDDNHLLETILAILSKGSQSKVFGAGKNESEMVESGKITCNGGEYKTYTVSAVKKRILENLEK